MRLALLTLTLGLTLDAAAADIRLYTPAPADNTGVAVVVCPGGSYAMVSMPNEGEPVSEFFASHGITAAVVNYTLPAGDPSLPSRDVAEAMALLRSRADSLGIDPSRIGIMGSSAGGHLAATASTAADTAARPAFTILLYPVISSRGDLAHRRSFKMLLGEEASRSRRAEYSCELRVDSHTPPALMLLADDDPTVDPRNSVEYYLALKRYGIPASLHIYPRGKHGFGFTDRFDYLDGAQRLILDWITHLYNE